MKTFGQLTEDIEARREELKQRSQERMQKFKEKSATGLEDAEKQAASNTERFDADNQAARERAQEFRQQKCGTQELSEIGYMI